MKLHIDIRRNADGTVTAICDKYRESFMIEPWDTDESIYEKALWALITGGMPYPEDDKEGVLT